MAKKTRKPREPSSLEYQFLGLWKLLAKDWPEPVMEHRFVRIVDTKMRTRYVTRTGRVRAWRFDFAWLDQKVAVEMEGGVFTGGDHTRGKGFDKDTEKYNAATTLGWRVLRYTIKAVEERPTLMIEEIQSMLGGES